MMIAAKTTEPPKIPYRKKPYTAATANDRKAPMPATLMPGSRTNSATSNSMPTMISIIISHIDRNTFCVPTVNAGIFNKIVYFSGKTIGKH